MENTIQPTPSVGLNQKVTAVLEQRPVILQLLRFGAVGVINTGLDYLILNFLIAQFHITAGGRLGLINIPGVVLAIVQSYVWNRYWAFGEMESSQLFKNFIRLVLVGGVGVLAVFLALLGAYMKSTPSFFVISLAVFIALEVVLWQTFGLFKNAGTQAGSHLVQFTTFLLVSAIGLAINSGLVVLITHYVQLVQNGQLNANLAKIVATVLSLVWNFIGYKIFVFKK